MDDGHLSNKNEDSNINESGSETDIPRYENTDYILISENQSGDVQDVSENNSIQFFILRKTAHLKRRTE